MPGIVVFRRRWGVGSDDFVVPAVFLLVLHIVWILVLGVILVTSTFDLNVQCMLELQEHMLGYVVILTTCIVIEGCITWVSLRGSILYIEPRCSMQYLLYVRLVILLVEFSWMVVGILWMAKFYVDCDDVETGKFAVLGIMVSNGIVVFSVLVSLWCTYDAAGRSWVKMKRYQESVKERERKGGRRSGSRRRNWRHRKAIRQYEQSWDRRFRMLFCCMSQGADGRNTFTEIAKLFTEFFRELDVVPSDVVAGLMLLRLYQKNCRKFIVSQGSNDVYQYLSGVAITPRSRFLHLNDPLVLAEYRHVIHYMELAMAAYGWPLYVMMHSSTGLCHLTKHLRCGCCCAGCVFGCGCRCMSYSLNCCGRSEIPAIVDDNCCHCNYAALKQISSLNDEDIVYATFHVDIGETPFYVAIDHKTKSVVISIRGTLSLQDVLTDLKAEAEILPVEPVREDWLGHKGMVEAALYIKRRLKEEMILATAFSGDRERKTHDYGLVLVGHSLGAGTAAILAILMRQEYPTLKCYAYSPPGGLLSMTAVEETKSFITSVVIGKDVVPRIGLSQMENMRSDLIKVIKRNQDPKWKVIFGSLSNCCGDRDSFITVDEQDIETSRDRQVTIHPSDSQLALTTHTPLYPPGKIIHIVRNHPPKRGIWCSHNEPVYQAVWTDNNDLDEVLISPTMINDHMPDKVLEALRKVLVNVGPSKPVRKVSEGDQLLVSQSEHCLVEQALESPPSGRVYMETSFTDARPEATVSRPQTLIDRNCNTSLLSHSGTPVSQSLEQIGDEKLAPLATPETLSDASSNDSMASLRRVPGSQQKTVAVLEPIIQSPIQKKGRPEAYCYYASEGQSNRNCFVSDCENVKCVLVDAVKDGPNVFTTKAITIDNAGARNGANGAVARTRSNVSQATPEISHFDVSAEDGDWNPAVAAVSGDDSMLEAVMAAGSVEQQSTNVNQSPFQSTVDSGETTVQTSPPLKHGRHYEENQFIMHDKHSPTFSNQMEYHSIVGHYSPGGRGYPHGAYQRPKRDRTKSKHEDHVLDILTSSDDSDKVTVAISIADTASMPRYQRYNSVETSLSSDAEITDLTDRSRRRDPYMIEDPGIDYLGPLESDV